jgi:hypothetical protein
MHVWFGQGEVHTHRIRLTPNTNSNHAAQSAAFAAAEAARSAVLFSLSANAEKHQSAAARSCVSVRRSKRSRAGMIRHPSDFDYEDIIPPECPKKSDTHKQRKTGKATPAVARIAGSYDTGGCVTNIISCVMGDDVFKQAVHVRCRKQGVV